ncbi:roadblock/LC7 domain-containing protein [Demequina sediminicola]|uniref:roadblock/LC7 domain-containing protein n=1 Tax=Demequina sediminicola TaxID=1095026 RepID=UPI0007817CA9|nr:roadblock/LC7 domain-containing protein [Demequina sediminicola]
MILEKHGMMSAARLKKCIPGTQRVIIARTDGLALYDDVQFAARDGAAALTAATLGLAATATNGFGLGAAEVSVLRGELGTLVVAPVDAGHLLALVVEPTVDATGASVMNTVRVEAEHLRALSGLAPASR